MGDVFVDQGVDAAPTVLGCLDEVSLAQDLEVMGDQWLADLEPRPKLGDVGGRRGQPVHDAGAHRMGERAEESNDGFVGL